MKLRSVELEVTEVEASAKFLVEVWGLADAGRRGKTAFFRGTGAQPYVLALTQASTPAIASVTFSVTPDELQKIGERVNAAGAARTPVTSFDEPGSGRGFCMEGPEGQVYRFVTEQVPTASLPVHPDRPIGLTHAVFNTRDREAATRFMQEVLGWKLSDRTRGMNFVRCDETHHSVAYADSDVSTLNHLAFEMPTLDSVMNGIGRLKEHGIPAVWGPGRHGPGNNVFGYFVAPFGGIIEYTSEIQRVDDSYRTGGPEDWKWPPGRGDHWGITGKDDKRMHEAERKFRFKALSGATATA